MLKLILCENETELCSYHITNEQLKEIQEIIEERPAAFSIKKQDRTEHVLLSQVRYFVSDRRKIKTIFLSGDSVEFYMKMKDLDEQLSSSGFLRCHQSYLINMKQILYWDECNITLIGGEIIPVSRKYKNIVVQKLKGDGVF